MLRKEYLSINKDDLKNPIVIVGLPGIGLVGKLAVDAIIEYCKPKKIADLYPFDFPPRVVVDSKGIPKAIKVSVYLWKRKNAENDVILITSDAQPYSIEGQYRFANELIEYIKQFGINLVIACAASVTPIITGDPKVHVTTANEQLMKKFLNHPLSVPFKNGVISGGNGLIPVLASELHGIDGICLLAETPGIGDQVDPKASKSIVRVLNDLFNLNVDLSNLDKKIAILEKERKALEREVTPREKGPSEEGPQSYIS